MYIVSFDMGISNLAYCVIECTSKNDHIVREWKRINLGAPKSDLEALTFALFEILDHIVFSVVKDTNDLTFLIENQPVFKAPTMKSLQIVIYTYAMTLKKNIDHSIKAKFISASSKLKYIEKKTGNKIDKNYKSNKNAAIEYTEQLIKDNEFMYDIFRNEKKKDDICDTYLQALYYIDAF